MLLYNQCSYMLRRQLLSERPPRVALGHGSLDLGLAQSPAVDLGTGKHPCHYEVTTLPLHLFFILT